MLAAWLLFVPSAFAIHATSATRDAVTIAHITLRHQVVTNRDVAWRWQDKAGIGRTPTTHEENRVVSNRYLRWLVHRWWHRAHKAMRVYHRHQVTQSPTSASTPFVDRCLSELISRESGWDVHAYNPSGAYGLPQALPGSKMASAGSDWRDNPATQIRWMWGYVQQYGGSCGALAFQIAHGWY